MKVVDDVDQVLLVLVWFLPTIQGLDLMLEVGVEVVQVVTETRSEPQQFKCTLCRCLFKGKGGKIAD